VVQAALLGGMGLGVLLGDGFHVRRTFLISPVLSEMIRWERLEELFESGEISRDGP
jgi:hypothetical protein